MIGQPAFYSRIQHREYHALARRFRIGRNYCCYRKLSPYSMRVQNGLQGSQRMQLRLSRDRWIEAVLLLPTTAVLGPALPFGVVFTALTLGFGLVVSLIAEPGTFVKDLHSSGELAALLLMMAGATAGLGSMWLTILFGREWALGRACRRYALVTALVVGLAAAAYWFVQLGVPPRDSREWKAFWAWVGLLLPACALALRYLWILLTSPAIGLGET